MSMEVDTSPQPSPLESCKKRKTKTEKKLKRKRKHNDSDNPELAVPAKKQRSIHQPGSPPKTDVSVLQSSSVNESPFYEQTSSLYLPLSPISYQHPESGLCAEHLSPLILTYFPPFNGVILSYCNVRLSADPTGTSMSDISLPVLAKSIDEYAVSFIWVTADFLIFRPRRHNLLEGWINLQNEGILGLVYLNFFNVSIERKNLPREWTWVPWGRVTQGSKNAAKGRKNIASEEMGIDQTAETAETATTNAREGHFEDGHRRKVEGLIQFRIKNVETSKGSDRENGFVSIEGTMLGEEASNRIHNKKITRAERLPVSRMKLHPNQDYFMSGALLDGSDVDIPP